jgi:hypothetical protein
MANTAFGSQKPEKIAPVLEEMLRKEIGAPMPIAYQILNAETRSVSAQSLLSDYGRMIVGGNETPLFLFQFTLAMPRPAELQVRVNRQGIGAHVGLLSYAARLVKPIGSEVSLEPPKMFGASKCIGDPQGIARLNNNGDLLKRLNKLARTESEVGGLKLKIERFLKIVPQASGSLFILNTLPRATSMGFGATLDAKEFLDLVALVEATL